MKTIREWFELLPSDIREKALRNTRRDGRLDEHKEDSLGKALSAAFAWVDSPEEDKFWRDIQTRARKGEFPDIKELAKKRIKDLTEHISSEDEMFLLL